MLGMNLDELLHPLEKFQTELLTAMNSIGHGLELLNAKQDKVIELLEEIKNNRDYSDF